MKTTRTLLTALALTLSLSGANAIIFTTSFHIPAGNTTWDGDDIIVQGCTLTVDGPHSFRSLTLNGAVLNHSPAPNGETNNRIQIAVTGDVLVDAVSRVEVSGRGYLAAGTPGAAPRAPVPSVPTSSPTPAWQAPPPPPPTPAQARAW